jgi:seryl-tRNA synthetase
MTNPQTSTALFEIVTLDEAGQWVSDQLGTDNVFDTREEAEAAIIELRKLGEDWAEAEYDVREIDAPFERCIYCYVDVPAADVPAYRDDEAWAEIATHHAADCEWVTTRAHRSYSYEA